MNICVGQLSVTVAAQNKEQGRKTHFPTIQRRRHARDVTARPYTASGRSFHLHCYIVTTGPEPAPSRSPVRGTCSFVTPIEPGRRRRESRSSAADAAGEEGKPVEEPGCQRRFTAADDHRLPWKPRYLPVLLGHVGTGSTRERLTSVLQEENRWNGRRIGGTGSSRVPAAEQ